MKDEAKRINPDIRKIEYGKKDLKELTLYPLSIGDQFKVTNIITEVVQTLVAGSASGQLNDLAFMTAVIQALEKNIGEVLVLIAEISPEEAEEIINSLTNIQLMSIVESVWDVDYEPALKKGKDLFERGKNVFNSRRSSPSSSKAIHNTDSKTSTEKATNQEG
ncbi:MAG: hypothetical protein WC346_00190 [Methanogenium sp.]|jgi:hypothetical protein